MGDDKEFVENGYGNRTLAVKFSEFALAGPSKFSLTNRRHDVEKLEAMIEGLILVEDAMWGLSRQVHSQLESFEIKTFKRIPPSGTPPAFDNDENKQGSDQFEEAILGAQQASVDTMRLVQAFREEANSLRKVINSIGVDLKVDWTACATAQMASVAWLVRTGKMPPSSVHADAPGPFGRFLNDVLELLYEGFELGRAPSARSALRSLQNVTSSGSEPVGNW
ncbi:hypothetical protein HKCCSP123_01995 [Rhodobacterales bacterium HKCCSP123]|nr:hypothetical protein [Rhodobacterales bacterium HKCCSP123]